VFILREFPLFDSILPDGKNLTFLTARSCSREDPYATNTCASPAGETLISDIP
jgi:hypothetical protein